MIKVRIPGKLFIAGEYAVVNKGYPAILIAVDKFIDVTIKKSNKSGSIYSKQYQNLPLTWYRINNKLVVDVKDNPFNYLLEAIKVAEHYALSKNTKLDFFDLNVDSQLISKSNKKLGLGSSGAITVATIIAILKFYNLTYDDLLIYKLAALTHINLDSNGSFGDLAASIYTGMIKYHTFDKNYIKQYYNRHGLVDTLKIKWPNLQIEPLNYSNNLNLIVGWSESPASTHIMVDNVNSETSKQLYNNFLLQSKEVVDKLANAINDNDLKTIYKMIDKNRQLLLNLNKNIETKELSNLITIANNYGIAKTSGAGGGDCGIAFIKNNDDIEIVIDKWKDVNIKYLDIKIYSKEVKYE